jgi:hypothetical protein
MRASAMTSLSPSLAALRDELGDTTRRLHALVDPLDDSVWGRRPAEGRWSVAECVEHLNLTSRAFVPLLREALRDGRSRGLTTPQTAHRLDLMGWFLVRGNESRDRRSRMKTPPPFVPAAVEAKAPVVRAYEELQGELVRIVVDAEGLALGKIKVTSPFNARLRYSAYSALRVIASHQRRHIWQAEQALAAIRAAAR